MSDDAFSTHLPEPPPRPPSARGRALISLGFVGLFAIACWLPAFHLSGHRARWSGMEVLVLGPMSLRLGTLGWLANFTALAAVRSIMKGRTTAALVLTCASLALALHTLVLFGKTIPLGEEDFNVVHVESLGWGFYVWLVALLVPAIAALIRIRQT